MKAALAVSALLALLRAALPASVEVWAAPSVYKIRPDDSPQAANLVWDGAARTVSIAGARNEHVPFQLVISAPPPPSRYVPAASGFFVEAGDLVSGSGRIPRGQIRLFLQHYVLCPAPSSPAGGAGFWPDALAPLTDPFAMSAEFRRAVRNRPLWIDVVVPEQAAPGDYEGALRVTQHGKPVAELKLRLKVHDYALPAQSRLVTYMGLSAVRLARLHNLREGSPEARRLLMRYHQFLYENRMEPWFNELLEPEIERKGADIRVNFDRAAYQQYLNAWKTKRVVLESAPDRLRRVLDGEPFSETFNRQVRSYLSQVAAWFRENGWADRLVFNSPIDEPNTAEQYEQTRRWARLVREAAPGIPFLVTEAPVPDRPEWGPLTGFATHFSVHGNALNRSDVLEAIRAEQQKGGEITWYISCDQRFPQPNYFIDGPAMDPVMVPWITWRLRLDGILYWALDFWSQTVDPWLNPNTYLSGFFCSGGWVLNGEGSLLYPGSRVRRYTGQRDVDGPVSSIRFELLREGIEDYERLWLLRKLGDGEFADRLAARLVRGVRDFSRDPGALFRARAEMHARLEELSRRAPSTPGR
ncbi:MAG: DUF4091 domain-containing protein [Bryobacteraceae bacterium]|nr:DUF4091 domain-containing protein [Bryobacteraceae bacterium]